jgi:hypothetical protein
LASSFWIISGVGNGGNAEAVPEPEALLEDLKYLLCQGASRRP